MPSEQATAAAEEIVNGDGKWESDPKQVKRVAKIIDAAFAPVVAERDALLNKCLNLPSLGIAAMGYTFRGDEKSAKEQTAMIDKIKAEITAMIGEQA